MWVPLIVTGTGTSPMLMITTPTPPPAPVLPSTAQIEGSARYSEGGAPVWAYTRSAAVTSLVTVA